MQLTKLRLALAIVVVVLLGAGVATGTDLFDDVDDGRFFSAPAEWAANNGITNGCGGGNFCPNDPVTRGENITFAKRYDDNIVQPALTDLEDQIDALTSELEAAKTSIANLPDVYFAEIAADGSVLRASFGVTTEGGGDGSMDVNWPLDVDDCVWQATIAEKNTNFFDFDENNGEVSLQTDFDAIFEVDPAGIFVETRDSDGTVAEMPVHIVVTC
ncbi:MAG: S-layer homology domain-containing protein [Actinomycetota bacterium]